MPKGKGKKKAKSNKTTIADYLDHLDALKFTGFWEPAGSWHQIHGTCRSTTGGVWCLFIMKTSTGTYKVKVEEQGEEIYMKEYDEEPEPEKAVSDLKTAFAKEGEVIGTGMEEARQHACIR